MCVLSRHRDVKVQVQCVVEGLDAHAPRLPGSQDPK